MPGLNHQLPFSLLFFLRSPRHWYEIIAVVILLLLFDGVERLETNRMTIIFNILLKERKNDDLWLRAELIFNPSNSNVVRWKHHLRSSYRWFCRRDVHHVAKEKKSSLEFFRLSTITQHKVTKIRDTTAVKDKILESQEAKFTIPGSAFPLTTARNGWSRRTERLQLEAARSGTHWLEIIPQLSGNKVFFINYYFLGNIYWMKF